MAAQQVQTAEKAQEFEKTPRAIDVEKQDAAHKEFSMEIMEDKQRSADYAGATKKTDPAEIKLVKKLDRWIMVRLRFSEILFGLTMSSQRCG